MKRRISDMLDHMTVEAIDLEQSTSLSSRRIKEMTMKKIEKKEKNNRSIGIRFLALAAVISILGVTAFAAEEIFGAGDFFRNIMEIRLQESRDRTAVYDQDVTYAQTISEEQIEVVNELGTVFEEQTYTDQGTTMTMTAAYADENIVQMYLKLEAPEGTVLPDDILYTFCDWSSLRRNEENGYSLFTVAEDAPYGPMGFTSDCIKVLPDSDPADNKKEFLVTLTNSMGGGVKFNDGYSKYLHIDGIWQQVVNAHGDEDGYELIVPGKFTFDFGIVNQVKPVKLDVDGLTYGGHKTRTWTHDSPCIPYCDQNLTGDMDSENGLPIHAESWNYTVTARKLEISPLSGRWECSYECDNPGMELGLGFRVILKDGTSVPVSSDDGGNWGGEGNSRGTTYFAVPIDLNQVDYILLGDPEIGSTHKVYLP